MAQQQPDDQLEFDFAAGSDPYDDDLDTAALDRGDAVAAAEEPPAEEPPAEEPPAEEPENKRHRVRIPKERFDEINEQRKAALAKIEELERQLQAKEKPQEYDFDARERDYMDAVLDGRLDDAAAIRQEIRQAEQAMFQQTLQGATEEARQRAVTEVRIQEVVEELEQTYPVFDVNSEEFDQDLADEVLVLQKSFVERGLQPDTALRKAAAYVAKANDITPVGATPEQPAGLRRQAPSAPQGAVERKMEAARRQPPSAPSRAREEPTIDIANMTDEDFENLSEEALRKLRGDFG